MRTVIAFVLAAPLAFLTSAQAQQTQDGQNQQGLGPAVPGLSGLSGLGGQGNQGDDQPGWMPKPVPLSPPDEPRITKTQAMTVLQGQGYYDIQPLKATPEGFTTQAWRYGKQVTLNISRKGGFVTEAGNGD